MKAYLNEHNVEFGDKSSIKQINNEMEFVDTFLNEYNNLNDIEKYNLLTHFYSFFIEDEDFIKLINIKYGTNFNKIISIPTKMEYFQINQIGLGRDSSLRKEKFQVILECAANDSFYLKADKYSYEKIMKLIKNKQIYPIYSELTEVNRFSKKKEDYTPIKCLIPDQIDINKDSWEYNYRFKATNKNIPIIIKLIEETIPYSELLKGIKDYILKIVKDFESNSFICYNEEIEIQPILVKFYENRFNKK